MRCRNVYLKLTVTLLISGVLSHCGKLDKPGETALNPVNPVVIPTSVFSVSIGTIWETDTSNRVLPQGVCYAPVQGVSGTQTCGVSTDTVSIPEALVYFGKLNVSVTIKDKSKCNILTFRPYYYQMSSSADFTPLGANTSFSALDCSASPIPVGCFAGPALELIPAFPNNDAIYYLPETDPDLTWTFKSPNLVRIEKNFNPGLKWLSNNLAVGSRGTAQDDYIANSMVDYRFTCADIYNDTQHTLTFKINPIPGPQGYQHSTW